ncbi:MAG: Lipid A biosynthesis lauroyltransferase [Chlamydiales bacterium]|nr:Lipid A biosynthesis lauroyltransferase [Chlamydiales bacterium]
MQLLVYLVFRTFGFFISQLPYSAIHFLGKITGRAAYYIHRPFRKKALANLAIAYGATKTEKEREIIAKRSFESLMITLLEFFRFKKSHGKLSEIVTLHENPAVEDILNRGQGVVFLSGHQANWEIPFLALTNRYAGVAIGRPIKNKYLYKWVLAVREMNGGKIVMPKNAIRSGLKALKTGAFLGIVGDQAYPESPYSYPLFGTRAWTASTPALIAYKTNSPLVFGSTKRVNNHYIVQGSAPIWPNLEAPLKEEVPRMMDLAMQRLESSIDQTPEQWMWVHDRWKQQGIDHVKRKYRYGFILITLPKNPQKFLEILPLFRAIYTRSFLTFLVPEGIEITLKDCEIITYKQPSDLFIRDYRYQLVLDFYDSKKLRRHFLKLGAFKALHLKNMRPHKNLSETIKHKLVKSECLTTVSF